MVLAVRVYAFIEGSLVVAEALQFSDSEYNVIYDTAAVMDIFLLGFSALIASVGGLFVGMLPNTPDWLHTEDLEALKGVLIKKEAPSYDLARFLRDGDGPVSPLLWLAEPNSTGSPGRGILARSEFEFTAPNLHLYSYTS